MEKGEIEGLSLESMNSSMGSSIEVLSMPRDAVEDEDTTASLEHQPVGRMRDEDETAAKYFPTNIPGVTCNMSYTGPEGIIRRRVDPLETTPGSNADKPDIPSASSKNSGHEKERGVENNEDINLHQGVQDGMNFFPGRIVARSKQILSNGFDKARIYGPRVLTYSQQKGSQMKQSLTELSTFLIERWRTVAVTVFVLFYIIESYQTAGELKEIKQLSLQSKWDIAFQEKKLQAWVKEFESERKHTWFFLNNDIKKRAQFQVKLRTGTKACETLKTFHRTESVNVKSEYYDEKKMVFTVPIDGTYQFDARFIDCPDPYRVYLYVAKDDTKEQDVGQEMPGTAKTLQCKQGDKIFMMWEKSCNTHCYDNDFIFEGSLISA